jgi:hypothetical protein
MGAGLPVHHLLGQRQGEGAPLPVNAVHCESSLHERGELLAYGKAQARPSLCLGKLVVHLYEGVEYGLPVLFLYSYARVLHHGVQGDAVVPVGLGPHLQLDKALLGEFGGVVEQIQYDLPYAVGVAPKHGRRGGSTSTMNSISLSATRVDIMLTTSLVSDATV